MQAFYSLHKTTHQSAHAAVRAATNYNTDIKKKLVRFVSLVLVMTVCITFGAILHANATTNGDLLPVQKEEKQGVFVKSGDTLWDIARTYGPKNADIRKYIHQLKQENHLQGSVLQEGQKLILP